MNPLKVKLYNFMDKIKNENNVESNITYNEGADIILLSCSFTASICYNIAYFVLYID